MSSSHIPDSMPDDMDGKRATYDKTDALRTAIERALVAISAHADTVQIFATRHDDEGTHEHEAGVGNSHARLNQARMWVRTDDAVTIRDRMREDG